MAAAISVVDMLRGFLEQGNPLYCGDAAPSIIPNIRRLLEEELAKGGKAFFICDHHSPDDLEFNFAAFTALPALMRAATNLPWSTWRECLVPSL